MTRRAFTLIEVLVALAIGMLLAGMATSMVYNVWRLSARAMVRVALHDDAAAFITVVGSAVRNLHHGGQWALESSPGADGVWDSGDEWVSLTFLSANEQRVDRAMIFGENPRVGLGWFRLRWDAAKAPARGRLRISRGSPWRATSFAYDVSGSPRSASIEIDPLPRRDRRRPLDDNDLRLVPGIDAATLAALALPGDSADLDAQLSTVIAPTTSAEDFRIGWTDRAGRQIQWSAQQGLSVKSASGSTIAALGQPWWNATTLILDGDFLDARHHLLTPDTISAGAARPMLLRLSFTLTEAPQRAVPGASRAYQKQDFAFSFALGPDSPSP